MTVSEGFTEECRGMVFETPCPDSFVAVNRVVGNLIVEEDPMFGGGHLSVSGTASNGDPFHLVADETSTSVASSGDIGLTAGHAKVRIFSYK